MNIFLRELRANLRSLIIWSVVTVLFIVVGTAKFSAYYGNEEMLTLLESMPPALMDAFKMNAFNLTTVTGFFGVMFVYFSLIASISAAMWGSDVIAKEERDKTVEFTLVLPVTRQKLITGKILAVLVDCVALLVVMYGATLVTMSPYNPDSEFFSFLNLSMVAIFIIQMVFLAVGFFLGCSMKQYKRAGAVAIALLLGAYFLSIISALNEKLDFLRYLSPFTYFDPVKLLNESAIDFPYVLLSLTIIAVLVAAGYYTYARRDLYI